MDLITRKYGLIAEFMKLDNESVLDRLEEVLNKERESRYKVSDEHKNVLTGRLEKYKENPKDVLDWNDMLTD